MDLDSLVNLEQGFFDEGYKDGYDHGRIHGLIEGRALGREKGYEMWEELGFYEGFAVTWGAIHHINGLLSLISQFPQTNPSPRSFEEGEVDILKLLRQIRSKYKLLCAILGIRPRVHSATEPESGAGEMEAEAEGMKKKIKPSIWEVQSAKEEEKVKNPTPIVTSTEPRFLRRP
ncbi:hypothetical protein BKA70DRAFT_1370809 [Coprinopsis sp. MPI-PUGE-AT-0042]|nr:hypothetical protein BKA70DRAFT_1370809 [Coprinopsis sp. MPI-PUGE-AT-0042]